MKRQNGEGTWGKKTINGITYKRFSQYYPEGRKDFYGKSKKEIEEKVTKYNEKREKNIHKQSNSSTITFGDYAYNYINTVATKDISARTLSDYREIILTRVIPKECIIGNLQLTQITPKILSEYVDYLTYTKKYARDTIVKTIRVVRHALEYGIKQNEIPLSSDVLIDFRAPSERAVLTHKKEIPFLDKEDMDKLYKEAKKAKYASNGWAIILIMYTGLRIGELQELRWKDVDLSARTISISRVVTRIKTDSKEYGCQYTYIIKDTPKTPAGRRSIPLSARAQEAIEYFSELNPSHTDDDLVCIVSRKNPGMKNRDNLRRSLNIMLKNANCSVQKCGLHALRHSFGSRLLEEGTDIKVVSILMGHQKVSTTYDHYIHIIRKRLTESVKNFDNDR